jgi:hypothetical protein
VIGNDRLEMMFSHAAPRMRLLRKLLNMNPDLTEEVDMIDFVDTMRKLYQEDNAK